MKKPEKRINIYFFITRTIFSLFVFIPLIIVAVVNVEKYPDPMLKTGLIIGLGILSILCAIPAFILSWFSYATYEYQIKEDYLIVKKGVIFKSTQMIPIKRIQHIEKMQGPVQILLKQASVIVYTAGIAGNIQGLSLEDAEQILLEIKNHTDYHLKQLGDKVND